MIKWVAGARSHLAGTACIIILNRRMRVQSPKFLRLTSPGEQRSDDYIRPTFTPPRHACFQLMTHTNTDTQSHYRWIHRIVIGTVQGECYSCMHITQFQGVLGATPLFQRHFSEGVKILTIVQAPSNLLMIGEKVFPGFNTSIDENIICVSAQKH